MTNNTGDVSKCLRELAAEIDAGNYGDAHNVAWVVACGNGRIEGGMIAKAHLLLLTVIFCFAWEQGKLKGR